MSAPAAQRATSTLLLLPQHALRQPFYLVSDLKPLHQYYFRVRALTVNGWSAFTPESDPMTCSRRY